MNPDLLGPTAKLAIAHLELTTRCNLRCVYCEKSNSSGPLSEGADFPTELIPKLVADLRDVGLKHLRISGFGETTTHPDWMSISRQFIDAGFDIELVCNFAKRYSPEEIGTLARFTRLLVSCDTDDAAWVPKIRKKVSLDRILNGIRAIQTEAARLGIPGPNFCLSVVVTDQVVFNLENTFRTFLDLGFKEFFLNNFFTQLETFDHLPVRPLWAMPAEQRSLAVDAIRRAIATAEAAGACVVLTPGLIETASASETTSCDERDIANASKSPDEPAAASEVPTLSCLSLWRQTNITVDGAIQPCCIQSTPIMGHLQDESLRDILNGAAYREFRSRHLAGDIPSACVGCALAGKTTTAGLRALVASMIRPLSDIVDELLPQLAGKRVLIYGAGGHSRKLFEETDIGTLPLVGIVDRNPALHGKSIHGIPIHSVESIESLSPDKIVISSLELQDEIFVQLAPYREQGIETIKLY